MGADAPLGHGSARPSAEPDHAPAAAPRVPRADPAIFGPLVKHSVTIAGHATSIRIESLFWDALLADAQKLGVPLNALVAEIDVQRMAVDPPPNLASAIRLWVTSRHLSD